MRNVGLVAAGAVALWAAPSALGQRQFVLADRTADALHRLFDANNDGVVAAGEVSVWFSGANAMGTPGPLNPTGMGAGPNGSVLLGDQDASRACVYLLRDHNGDGDAQDVGESAIFVGPGNASGASTAFVSGCAFDRRGDAYFVNTGNALGRDAIYRARDLNCDGDANDLGEVTLFVGDGAFGPGNGAWGPQAIIFERGADVGWMRNSTANLHGIYRFEDVNQNGVADDAGEFTAFWDASANNQTGILAGPGFPIAIDPLRPRAMYTVQAPGGTDQLIRCVDVNNDGDSQDAGEAAVVYSNAAAGFTAIDVVALADGRVLITDNSGNSVVVLVDGNGDDDFLDSGESAAYMPTNGGVMAARQLAVLSRNPDCPGDTNDDRLVNFADLNSILAAFGAASVYGLGANINGDCGVTFADLNVNLANFGSACAP